MMEAVRTSETSVDNHFTRQYNPEDSSEHHTRRRENLKSHTVTKVMSLMLLVEVRMPSTCIHTFRPKPKYVSLFVSFMLLLFTCFTFPHLCAVIIFPL
jgi:hypothetical protein